MFICRDNECDIKCISKNREYSECICQLLSHIKEDADPLLCVAQIHLVCKSFRSNRFGLPGIEAGYRNRIKKCITGQDEPAALKPLCCQSGNSVDLFCYSPEPFGAVIDSIKACNHRQQEIGRASC